ncbi:hypothetical protein OW763_05490 [Clostridium aestuarii]|uniref:Uncharacterized protein n=1 Tax=Clostridium aestuarii TaxID=338193 RepID=A0ABT4CXS7_9CLOT|nr:hypothetical protein [Clostridium aestuarii]MCY6483801.1 hypothetical protein [Clostridium aestuarii]
MNNLFNKLINSIKASDIVTLVECELKNKISWKSVGGENKNNYPIINIGSDPAAGITERITNAIDSVIERAYLERQSNGKGKISINSPREASKKLFNVKDGQLTNLNDKEIQTIAKNVIVTLRNSDEKKKPTIDIRDKGTGIKAIDFEDSILSLNAGRKLNKLYLSGAYGQGGSTALAYSKYTLILSRAVSKIENLNKVAYTLVRYNPGDINKDKIGVYEFMVDKITGYPLEIDIPLDEFDFGTLVRHIEMDIGKYSSIMTAPTGSLWYLVHNYLFNTVLPFKIEEQRNNKSKNSKRNISGNCRRLSKGNDIEYQGEAYRNFNSGKIKITWWVIKDEKENSKNIIKNYTLPSKPIIITYNGQKHDALSNSIIKKDLKLPYLDGYLIIHVNCDELDNKSRRELFVTTRESVRESTILEELEQLVINTLKEDDNLKVLNNQRKQKFLTKSNTEVMKKLGSRIANKIKTTLSISCDSTNQNSNMENNNPTTKDKYNSPNNKPHGDKLVQSLKPIPTNNPPQLLKITSHNNKKIYVGDEFALHFITDADPKYFKNNNNFNITISSQNTIFTTGKTKMKQGHGVIFFKVNSNLKIGDIINIRFDLKVKQTQLSDDINVVVTQKVKNNSKNSVIPKIEPIPVEKSHPYWIRNGWDENSVAKVERSEQEITVYISIDNINISRIINKQFKSGKAAVEAIQNFYLEHICYHAVLLELDYEKEQKIDDTEVIEQFKVKELRRESKTICGIIEDIYKIFKVEAAATTDN